MRKILSAFLVSAFISAVALSTVTYADVFQAHGVYYMNDIYKCGNQVLIFCGDGSAYSYTITKNSSQPPLDMGERYSYSISKVGDRMLAILWDEKNNMNKGVCYVEDTGLTRYTSQKYYYEKVKDADSLVKN